MIDSDHILADLIIFEYIRAAELPNFKTLL